MDENRSNYIRNLWSLEISEVRRFVGSKTLAKIFMTAYIIMIITLVLMIFVLVGNIIARHIHEDDEPEEDVNHNKAGIKSLDYSDLSGFLYLLILVLMVGSILCCRPCSLCGVTSPHHSGYEEI